jgi:Spy/CpxP family protein refolding chaperone
MKKLPSVLVLLLVVFVVACVASFIAIALSNKWQKPVDRDSHYWIHTQLGLTAEQEKALEPIEKNYRDARANLEQRLVLANRELAEAILAVGRDSDRVHDAIEKIHTDMGDLQKLTIGHVFEMRTVLSPEQYKKLLNLTANALYNLDSRHGGE